MFKKNPLNFWLRPFGGEFKWKRKFHIVVFHFQGVFWLPIARNITFSRFFSKSLISSISQFGDDVIPKMFSALQVYGDILSDIFCTSDTLVYK